MDSSTIISILAATTVSFMVSTTLYARKYRESRRGIKRYLDLNAEEHKNHELKVDRLERDLRRVQHHKCVNELNAAQADAANKRLQQRNAELMDQNDKLEAEIAEYQADIDQLNAELLDARKPAPSLIFKPVQDPLLIANPMVCFREHGTDVKIGPWYTIKWIPYTTLYTHMEAALRNGYGVSVDSLKIPTEDKPHG